jgi:hypothetical protein
MTFVFNDKVYQPASMVLMFDTEPIVHIKKISLKQDVEMTTQYRGIGIGEKHANTPRGVTRGKRTWSIDIEMPLGTYLDWAANYYMLKGQSLVGGTRPTVAVMTMYPNTDTEAEKLLKAQVFQFEFYIKSEDGHGGESGSTDEVVISLSGECTAEPRQLYGGRPISGI